MPCHRLASGLRCGCRGVMIFQFSCAFRSCFSCDGFVIRLTYTRFQSKRQNQPQSCKKLVEIQAMLPCASFYVPEPPCTAVAVCNAPWTLVALLSCPVESSVGSLVNVKSGCRIARQNQIRPSTGVFGPLDQSSNHFQNGAGPRVRLHLCFGLSMGQTGGVWSRANIS